MGGLNTARMLVLRNSASLDVVASLSRKHVHAVGSGVRAIRVAPFTHLLDASFARPRFHAQQSGGSSQLLVP
jgi:hypothetical protein